MTESELVEGLKNQDRKAVRFFVGNYGERIIKTIYYFVGNMEDAQDLSQDVFIEILRSSGKFNKKAALGTWIYRITINKSLDHLRKQKRREWLGSAGRILNLSSEIKVNEHTNAEMPDLRHEEMENRRILEHAVNSLPQNQKIAFILSKYEEKPYKEISQIMNISLSSVESLLHRAKKNLQKKLITHFSEYASNRNQ
jgi:RNA polymerase sigma-70 factor, ECF subfamily